MKTRISLSLLALVLVLSPSCKNSPTQISEVPSMEFPNNIGNSWTYSHFDSLAQKSDSVLVTIVGQTNLTPDQVATIWQFKYPNRIDTGYVTVSQDTVRLVSSGRSFRILFPLQVGNKWVEDYVNDTNRVVGYGPITVVAGSFSGAYQIVESWGGFNDYGSIARWFVPAVGIVRMYHRGWSFGEANETYELIRYQIIQ